MGAGAAPARMRAGGPRTQARAYGLPAGGFGRAQPSQEQRFFIRIAVGQARRDAPTRARTRPRSGTMP